MMVPHLWNCSEPGWMGFRATWPMAGVGMSSFLRGTLK